MLINSPNISGSLTVTGNATISGSLNVAGGINATITGSATSASYVEYSNVANKPTLVSGSEQISFNGIVDKPTLVSGSSQVTYSGLSGIPAGIVSGSSQISFNGITDKPTLVSGSSQITYSGISSIPSGIVSGSAQVSFNGITDKPTLVSGSSQVTYSEISSIPAGIVSSSTQIAGYNLFATTGSNQFNGSQAITGSLTVTGQVVAQTLNVQQVTSSIVYSSGSNIFGNDLGNTQQFTGSLQVSGSSHYVLGNVGINTSSPSTALTVIGNVKAGYDPGVGLTIGLSPVGIPNNDVNAYILWGDAASFGGNNGDLIYIPRTSTSADHRFYTGNAGLATEKMCISYTGNVGIGTNNPTAPLDTNGVRLGRNWSLSGRSTIRLDSDGTSSPADILFGHTSAANQTGWTGVYWSLSSRAAENGNKFLIYRGNGQPAPNNSEAILFAIQPDGKVGIGTDSPSTKLHIQDNFDPDDALGYVLVENTNTSSGGAATNSALNVKNYHGTSQFMQWQSFGLRIGSRILTNGGVGDVIFTAGADSEKMRLLANGGLTFNGDTAAANALDDYEEGTWTPTFQTFSFNISANYDGRLGSYTKIGNMVYAFFDMSATSISGTLSGAIITGLPYTVSNSLAGYSVGQYRDASGIEAAPDNTVLKGFTERGQSYIYLQFDNTGAAGFATNSSSVGWKSTGGRITGYVIYQA
jgi:hypothetical protein